MQLARCISYPDLHVLHFVLTPGKPDLCDMPIVCFEQAIDRAAQLDKHFAATGELVGPLHGLP